MGSSDYAVVSELVRKYALVRLPAKYETDIGLYRDEGFVLHRNVNCSEADWARKVFIKHFGSLGLRITIRTNL